MVKRQIPSGEFGRAAAERRVVLSYAPRTAREGLAALLALDDALADVLRSTREPMVGQMRLTWWHDAVSGLDEKPAPAQPVLTSLAARVVPHVAGSTLAAIVEGWEELLEPEMSDESLAHYAARRGGTLFVAGGALTRRGDDARLIPAGRAWALSDLAGRCSDPTLAARARTLAAGSAAEVTGRWPADLRALGALFRLAMLPAASEARRIGRVLLHRVTGY